MIRVIAITSQVSFLNALTHLFQENQINIVDVFTSPVDCFSHITDEVPDVVMIDVNWKNQFYQELSFSLIRKLKKNLPAIRIVGVTVFFSSSAAAAAKSLEMDGFVSRTTQDAPLALVTCIRKVYEGERFFVETLL